MNQRIFNIPDLEKKSIILFYSEDGKIDFAKECTYVESDVLKPFHVELYIYFNRQKSSNVFWIPVIRDTATVILTALTGYDIQKVNCKAF